MKGPWSAPASGPLSRKDIPLLYKDGRCEGELRPSLVKSLPVLLKRDINHGDLLFFRGEDFVSKIIEMGCSTLYSHVGTAIKVRPKFVLALKATIQRMNELSSKKRNDSKGWREIGFSNLVIATTTNSPSSIPYRKSNTLSYIMARCTSFQKHVLDMYCAYFYLISSRADKNSVDLLTAILEESRYLEKTLFPSTSFDSTDNDNENNGEKLDSREIYYWESTTDDTVECLLTGDSRAGVKLSKLSDRVAGYEDVVGTRKVVLERSKSLPSLPSSPSSYVSLLSFVCNVIINYGKPYQEDYGDMLEALFYSKFYSKNVCTFLCLGEKDVDEGEGGDESFLGKDFYHFKSEYDSFYCTELSMELLIDYSLMRIVLEKTRKEANQNTKTKEVDTLGLIYETERLLASELAIAMPGIAVPRTNVEMHYLVNKDALPVGTKVTVAPIETYQRVYCSWMSN